jgi:hypothetical protein
MKYYPTIEKFRKGKLRLHTFDKLDGSNLRFEWSKKRGWYKFGTRSRLFDQTDEVFGPAIPLFMESLSEPLGRICTDQRWQSAIVFAEFWGKLSFAGLHVPEDPKFLTPFDVVMDKKGFLPPKEFVKLFGEFGPNYLGDINWTPGFVEDVLMNRIEGLTFEGVVGKTYVGKRLVMYKAKTGNWVDKVKATYDPIHAKEVIDS